MTKKPSKTKPATTERAKPSEAAPSASETPTKASESSTSASEASASGTNAYASLDAWTRYWLAPVAAVRPWMLRKLVLLVLAFDVLKTHLAPAWRYGAGDFNVPHFAWMEALPRPTNSAYVGMLFLVAVGSLVGALFPRPPRVLFGVLAVAYTWGWSCSMLDSYQHHYLLGLVLLAFAFIPSFDSRDLFGGEASPTGRLPHGLVPRVHALGFTLLTSVCAVVYAFTARSKMEPEWLSGDAMRSITHDGRTLEGLMDFAELFGIRGDDFWWTLGHSVVPVQILIALGYALAPLLDGPSTAEERAQLPRLIASWTGPKGLGSAIAAGHVLGALAGLVLGVATGVGFVGTSLLVVGLSFAAAFVFFDADTRRFYFATGLGTSRQRVFRILGAVALALAISFHVGAEHLELEIGWFSAYMILIALVVFLPAQWLSLLVFALTSTWRARDVRPSTVGDAPWTLVLGLGGGAAMAVLGLTADLPGAAAVGWTGAAILVIVVARAMTQPALTPVARQLSLAFLVTGVALTGWLYATNARFDYYRFAGGDFRRRLEYEDALHAYRRANEYAPEGQSRVDRVEEMEARIRERRGEGPTVEPDAAAR